MAELPLRDAGGGCLLSYATIDDDVLDRALATGLFACSIVIVQRRQHVLLGFHVRRRQWELPGGTVEAGESAHDAALRELAEETGLRPNHVSLVARALFEFAGDATVYEAGVFHVTLDGPVALVESDELREFRWWDPHDDPWEATNYLDTEVIRRVVAGRTSIEATRPSSKPTRR